MKEYDPYDYIDAPPVYCSDCGEVCKPVEETFDYVGTHCTHGKSGTHHTGHYVSDCCGAELEDVAGERFDDEDPDYDDSTFANHDGTFAEND